MTIEEAKRRHQDALMDLPGVVSVGIGLNAQKTPTIMVGVKDMKAATVARVPRELEGHPVEVFEAGTIRAL